MQLAEEKDLIEKLQDIHVNLKKQIHKQHGKIKAERKNWNVVEEDLK